MKIAKLNNAPEIFYTIQGEGKNLGRPSVFIRTSLCNLYCIWCDTDYTWNWEGTKYKHVKDSEPDYKKFNKENQIIELTVSEIKSEVKKYNCKNIVLTGGEPMIQQKDLIGLISEMKNEGPEYFFEIETNGTIKPNDEFEKLIDQYNVSPKQGNSAVKKDEREKSEALSFFSGNAKSNFKFVVSKKEDINEILSIVEKYDISPGKVFLMPEGTIKEDLIQKRKDLIELCKKYSFSFTDRLHIHVFGNKRGV